MKCQEVNAWLLTAAAPATPPDAVRRHLLDCEPCRRCQRRLQRLEQQVQLVPLPPVSKQALERLFQRIDQEAAAPAPVRPSIGWRRPVSLLRIAAALLLAVGLAWYVWRQVDRSGSGVEPAHRTGPVALAQSRDLLIAGLVETDLRLAGNSTAQEKFQVVAGMAAELRREALRLAGEGSLEELQRVGVLHDRVLAEGLVRRGQALPASHKQALLVPILQELELAAAEAERAAQDAAGERQDPLRAMALAARETAQALQADAPVAPEPRSWDTGQPGTQQALLGALVHHGLRLADLNDPLRRADCYTDIADSLVQTILQQSQEGDADRASWLGKYLGAVMERGVASNLAQVSPGELDEPGKAELERVSRRASSAAAVLEETLQHAPAPAKAGLQKALEASGYGRGKANAKGKEKGKMPPGWLKGKGGSK